MLAVVLVDDESETAYVLQQYSQQLTMHMCLLLRCRPGNK
jgi:hypothetical protein